MLDRTVGKFGEKLGNATNAKNYLDALYNANEENKSNIAYTLGQTLTKLAEAGSSD